MVELVEGIQKEIGEAGCQAQPVTAIQEGASISGKEWLGILVYNLVPHYGPRVEEHVALEELAKLNSPDATFLIARVLLARHIRKCDYSIPSTDLIEALGKYGGQQHLPLLELVSNDGGLDADAAKAAITKLRERLQQEEPFSSKSGEELKRILETPGWQHGHDRRKAAKELASRRTASSVAAIISLCSHPEWDVRNDAISALGCIDDASVREALKKAAETDKSLHIRAVAKAAIAFRPKLPILNAQPTTASAAREIETAARKAKLVPIWKAELESRSRYPILRGGL